MGFRLALALVLVTGVVGCTGESEVGSFVAHPDSGVSDGSTEGGVHLDPVHTRLALGGASTCAINASGGVVCWGDNIVGELGSGDETMEMSSAPVPVSGLGTGVRAVFGGAAAECAVTEDGHATCWGDSVFGQFNDMPGVHAISYTPLDTPGLSSVVAMGIGTYFHCALNEVGGVKCYGLNGAGQLGTGSLADSYTPANVVDLPPSTQLTASEAGFFACAATSDGAAYCWGYNDHGQLGTDSKDDATKPEMVNGLSSGVTALAAGRDHACAIVSHGVKCWGSNAENQLGDASFGDQLIPIDVKGLPPIRSIVAGAAHTCALSDDGAVYCWGSSASDVTPTPSVVIASDVIEIGAGGNHSCALSSDQTLRCWGDDTRGQLGPFSGSGAPL